MECCDNHFEGLPECASEVRCGPKLETCCELGEVCSGDACVLPGLDCLDSYDCAPGEYCEQTLQADSFSPGVWQLYANVLIALVQRFSKEGRR